MKKIVFFISILIFSGINSFAQLNFPSNGNNDTSSAKTQGTRAKGHYIGELFGGGIVVAVWKSDGVEHGLIASLEDLSLAQEWSNIHEIPVGPSAQSATDGLANTKAILAQPGHTSSAALLCYNYRAGGFKDWYLPAKDELDACYKAFYVVRKILGNKGFASHNYWSSTEIGRYHAWAQGFVSGSQSNGYKSDTCYVRAVRAF